MAHSHDCRQAGRTDEQERISLAYAALLHDIGAASSWEEKHRIRNIHVVHENIYAHAEAGYELLKDSPQLGSLAEPIRYHHDRWDGSSQRGRRGKEIPLHSRIINLSDKVEVFIRDDSYIIDQRADILAAISKQSGLTFDPELVQALQEIASRESFWLDLTNPVYYQSFFCNMDDSARLGFHLDDILNVAEIFATIIDRTSLFTGTHSRSVARVAAFLSEAQGYSSEEVKVMRVAGLFHDIGKLAIPQAILEKPGPLTEREISFIKQHPYYTYRILEQIDGFKQIAEWAAFHHETLDGKGYPFRVKASDLKLGSRIVAVADVFVALTEARPYRGSLELPQVETIMRNMVANRKLDGAIVSDLFANGRQAYDIVQETAEPISWGKIPKPEA